MGSSHVIMKRMLIDGRNDPEDHRRGGLSRSRIRSRNRAPCGRSSRDHSRASSVTAARSVTRVRRRTSPWPCDYRPTLCDDRRDRRDPTLLSGHADGGVGGETPVPPSGATRRARDASSIARLTASSRCLRCCSTSLSAVRTVTGRSAPRARLSAQRSQAVRHPRPPGSGTVITARPFLSRPQLSQRHPVGGQPAVEASVVMLRD